MVSGRNNSSEALSDRDSSADDGHDPREQSAHGAPYRVLVVDDNPSIHDDFTRILSTVRAGTSVLDDLASSLFGIDVANPSAAAFELHSTFHGEDALDAVRESAAKGQPYALVFMDIRMPPGLNGIETTARLLDIDEFVHVILCTAYADHEWRRRVERMTASDRVLLLKKPFDPLEVKQLANAMCAKWTLARRDKQRLQELERAVSDKTRDLESANQHLRKEIAERMKAERDLRKAQRLEGLGRLAAGLCHEINNPLSFIIGSIEAMEEMLSQLTTTADALARQEVDELLHAATVGADRITQIVRNVKLFARQNDAQAEFVDVDKVIGMTVEMVRRNLEPHVQLVIDMEPGPPMRVLGRRVELEQVFINLVENAGQALAEKTNLDATIRVAARRVAGCVEVTVTDNGPGIPDDVIDKIFDPFFTTKPVNKGTGLGLSICHSLIVGMNGTIEVASRSGEGTAFTVVLPAVREDLVAEPKIELVVAAPEDVTRGKLLIVDDEPFILRMMQRTLRDHDVTAVSNVHEALSLCLANTYDIILSDIMMPGVSGQDFYRMLASARPGEEQKIVFVTGGTLISEVLEFLDRVDNPCLEKPVDARILRSLIADRVALRAIP